jgi:hypothetical protein
MSFVHQGRRLRHHNPSLDLFSWADERDRVDRAAFAARRLQRRLGLPLATACAIAGLAFGGTK